MQGGEGSSLIRCVETLTNLPTRNCQGDTGPIRAYFPMIVVVLPAAYVVIHKDQRFLTQENH